MTYTLTPSGFIVRDADQACIPDDPRNADRQAYHAWLSRGHRPNPVPAPARAELRHYAHAKLQAHLAGGRTFNIAVPESAVLDVLCDGTTATRADLALLAQVGTHQPTSAAIWIDSNNVATELTGAQCVILATLVSRWIAECNAATGALLAQIANGQVTTMAEIDRFAWPSG